VAFAADGQVLASASSHGEVKLWDARTGAELRTLRGHTRTVYSVAFAADGQVLASASADKTIKLWDVRTGDELRTLRGQTKEFTSLAFAADGQVLAASRDNTVKLWDARTGQDPEKERRFRLWVTAPDLHLHRELAEQADKDKQPFALAFRLGRYLAAQTYYAANPKDEVKPPFSTPTFPDGIACTGVLYKDSGIAPARPLIGTARALEGDPSNWLNHAFHGGALFRNGEHAKALAALNRAVELHGRPSPLTHNLLALTHLAMGERDKAKAAIAKAPIAKDAPWEDVYLQRLLQPEIDAALAKTENK
jgi:tetratricopeptide (TPR) repeat protein